MSKKSHASSSSAGPSQRQLRVGEEIRHLLAEVLARGELRAPELQDRTITVTEVRVSPDLKRATGYVMPLGGEHAPEVMAALGRCAPYLRGVVAHALGLRYAPSLDFQLDASFEAAQRIDALLHRPDVQRDLLPDSPSHEDDAG